MYTRTALMGSGRGTLCQGLFQVLVFPPGSCTLEQLVTEKKQLHVAQLGLTGKNTLRLSHGWKSLQNIQEESDLHINLTGL